MIVGQGDIASVLTDHPDLIIFASGVSNSNCTDSAQFEREYLLLIQQDKRKTLIYFSSIYVDQKCTHYFLHKRNMERVINMWFPNHNIIRIGNIDWGTNPNTFLNFLKNRIKHGLPFCVVDEYKYMITKDDLNMLVHSLPKTGKNKISAFSYMAKVKDLLSLNDHDKR